MSYKKYIAMIEKKVKPEKNKAYQQKACEGFGFYHNFLKKLVKFLNKYIIFVLRIFTTQK